MGRHSNLIFWEEASQKIITASHIVTKDMSRFREVAPGFRFVRAPGQEKSNFFTTSKDFFFDRFRELTAALKSGAPLVPPFAPTLEQWLINTYTGIGRGLTSGIVAQSGLTTAETGSIKIDELTDANAEKLWDVIEHIQNTKSYAPALKNDLSKYSVLYTGDSKEWKVFPSVNDMVDEYYRLSEAREYMNQLRERVRSDLKLEIEKLNNRIASVEKLAGRETPAGLWKRSGDYILANLHLIEPGATELVCDKIFDDCATDLQNAIERLEPTATAKADSNSKANLDANSSNSNSDSDPDLDSDPGSEVDLDQTIGSNSSLSRHFQASVADPVLRSTTNEDTNKVRIKLNPNLSASQNAQAFYRQFAKSRGRQGSADLVTKEATTRLELVYKQLSFVDSAGDSADLHRVKEWIQGRKPQETLKQQNQQPSSNKSSHSRLLSTTSSDGWKIYVGRNRLETTIFSAN